MLAVLRAKFHQNKPCADALLKTDDAYLLQHNASSGRDRLWSNNNTGDGTNWLGMQLMIIRDEMQVQKSGQSSWAHFIQDKCGIDLQTGESHSTVNMDAWQNTVQSA